jgi:hypothetical protein
MTDATNPPKLGRWLTWLFAGVGVLGVLAFVAVVALMLSFSMFGGRGDLRRLAAKSEAAPLSVQNIQEVQGTNFLWIELGYGGQGNPYAVSGRGRELRNAVLLDRMTGTSRRLLTGNDRNIVESWTFPARAESAAAKDDPNTETEIDGAEKKKPQPPSAYYALAVRQAKGEAQDLLVGEIATGRQAFVISGIDGVDRIWMLSPTQVAVLLREKMQLQYRVIDIPTLKTVTSRPVDIG